MFVQIFFVQTFYQILETVTFVTIIHMLDLKLKKKIKLMKETEKLKS